MREFHRIGILDTAPLIIRASTLSHVINPAWEIGHLLKGVRTYWLLSLSWSLMDEGRLEYLIGCYAEYKDKFPEHELIFLCNELIESAILNKFGIPAFFAPHNALIDYGLYHPAPEAEKKYDALINSRLDEFKRHILAKRIDRLAIITYFAHKTPLQVSLGYLNYLKRNMPQADFLNFSKDGSFAWLSKQEIAKISSQCHVGLIMSSLEGGCMAACEYLLSGLPVVSTKNQGGRDLFLPPEYSITVEPNFKEVRDATEELKSRDLNPYDVRAACIKLIDKYRDNYLTAWQSIYDLENIKKNAKDEWSKQFRHLLAENIYMPEIVKLFETIKSKKASSSAILTKD